MQSDSRVFVQPRLGIGVLVGGVVVADDTQPHPGMGLGDQLEEGQELGVGVPRVAGIGSDLAELPRVLFLVGCEGRGWLAHGV